MDRIYYLSSYSQQLTIEGNFLNIIKDINEKAMTIIIQGYKKPERFLPVLE